MKELFVYVVSATNEALDELSDISAYHINDWMEQSELCDDAKRFCKIAEEEGTVYSLNGLVNALNFEDILITDDWVFITNKEIN